MTLFQMNVTTEIALTGAAIVGLGAYMFASQGEEKAVEAEEKAVEAKKKPVEAGKEAAEAIGHGWRIPERPGGYLPHVVPFFKPPDPPDSIEDQLVAIMEEDKDYQGIIREWRGNEHLWSSTTFLDDIIGIPLNKMWGLFPETMTMVDSLSGQVGHTYYGGTYKFHKNYNATSMSWGYWGFARQLQNPKLVSELATRDLYMGGFIQLRQDNHPLLHREVILKYLFDYIYKMTLWFESRELLLRTGRGARIGKRDRFETVEQTPENRELAKIYALMAHMMKIEAYKVQQAKVWHHTGRYVRSRPPNDKYTSYAVPSMTKRYKESRMYNEQSQRHLAQLLEILEQDNERVAKEYVDAITAIESRPNPPAPPNRRRVQAIEDPTDPTLPIFTYPILVEPFNPPAPRL